MSGSPRTVAESRLPRDSVAPQASGHPAPESCQTCSALFDAAPFGIVVSDGDGRVVLANSPAEDMFGYAQAELLGQTVQSLLPGPFDEADAQRGGNHCRQVPARPEGWRRPLVGRRKDGTEFPVEVGVRLVPAGPGAVVVRYVQDLSERQRLRQELRSAQEWLRALAVENARLDREVQEREQQVGLLLRQIIDAQEAERERISMEIHDGVAQTLAAAFGHLQALESRPGLDGAARVSMAQAGWLVRHAIREAREVVAGLRPATLDALGLVATLRQELEDLRERSGLEVELDTDAVRLPKPVETALYRIVHEALTNVVKHAHASRVVVRVAQSTFVLFAEIQDDGAGFDLSAPEPQPLHKGVGLLSMRKRAESLHASFGVRSAPGEGTSVRVVVPIFS